MRTRRFNKLANRGRPFGLGTGGGGGGGPAFDPASLAGYEWGLDAGSAFTDAARTTPCATNGDLVASCLDLSGNGRHAVQATGANKPEWAMVGGAPALLSRLGSRKLVTSSFLAALASQAVYTLYSVIEPGDNGFKLNLSVGSGSWVGHEYVAGSGGRVDEYTAGLSNAGSTRHGLYVAGSGLVIATRYDGAQKRIIVVGRTGRVTTNHATTGSLGYTGTVTVGDLEAGGFTWSGLTRAHHYYSAAHTDEEVEAMIDHLTGRFLSDPAAGTPATGGGTRVVACDGNSLVLGTGGSSGTAAGSFPSQLATLLGGTYAVTNFGVNAIPTSTVNRDAEMQVDAIFDPAAAKCVSIVWEGTNDLTFGTTPESAFERLRDYVLRRRARGWKVIILTVLPRSDGGLIASFETSRLALNVLIRTLTSFSGVQVYDVAADARMGDAGDETDTNYYSGDNVHLQGAGYTIVANALVPLVQSA